MKLQTFSLIFLLVLTACAAPAAPQATASTFIKTQATAVPTEVPAEATFETSLLVTEWKGQSKGNLLYPLDPARGSALPGYEPIPLGGTYFHTFSPDRRTLAVLSFAHETANGNLLLIDLPTWKTRQFETELNGWVTAMVFSPDGTRLAITYGDHTHKLAVFDLQRGVITAQEKTDSLVTRLKFTADGEALMLYTINSQTTDDGMSATPPQVLQIGRASCRERV